ncbi:MAG: PAS domain S-box protein [Bernardetiaceae bacterium]|nr:PAS domain S-box protein [Bernardetiaceae bacterium]
MKTDNSAYKPSELLIEQLPVLVWNTDETLRLTYISGQLKHTFHIDTQLLLGRSIEEALLQRKPFFRIEAHKQSLHGIKYNFTFEARKRMFQVSISPLRNADNLIIGVSAMLTEMQVATFISKNNEDTFFENLPSQVAIVSLENNELYYINERFADQLLYTVAECKTLRPADIFIDIERFQTALQRIKRRRSIQDFELLLKRKNNKTLHVLLNAQIIAYRNEQCLLCEFTNITKYSRNEEKWYSLVKSAPNYVLHVDQEGQILFVNRNFMGLNMMTLMGRSFISLVCEEDKEAVLQVFEKVRVKHNTGESEMRIKDQVTDEVFWFNVRIAPLFTDKEPHGFAVIATDITENKAQEIEIRESRQKKQALIDTIPDQIMVFSAQAICKSYKPANKNDIYGQEIENQHISNIFPPVLASLMEITIRKTIEKQELQTLNYALQVKSKMAYYEGRFMESGSDEVLLIIRDVSEKREAEEEIKKGKKQYEQLINNIDEIVYVLRLNPETHRLYFDFVSKQLKNILGYETQEVFDNPKLFVEQIHPKEKATLKEIFWNAVNINKKVTRTYRIRHKKTGKYVWIEDRLIPQFSPDGTFKGVLGMARDVTKEKEAAKEIRESERKYRLLIETMHEPILVINALDKITFINKRTEELFGYPKEELQYASAKTLLAQPEEVNSLHTLFLSWKNEDQQQLELEMKAKNGQKIWVWVSSSPIIEENGEIFGSIIALADITPLKKAQDEVLAINKEMEQLLYRASHDLKGPISSIMGIINLMRMELKGDTASQFCDLMSDSIAKLSELIKDLSHVSSIKQGNLRFSKITLKDCLSSICKTYEYYPNYKKIAVDLNVSNDEILESDESLLRTIFQNFIENGIKYADFKKQNPYLKIYCYRPNPDFLHVIFEDNGIGISKIHQDKIFDMFFRATDQAKGSGLGLYIVQSAIRKLNGHINLESQENIGSKFEIILPAQNQS